MIGLRDYRLIVQEMDSKFLVKIQYKVRSPLFLSMLVLYYDSFNNYFILGLSLFARRAPQIGYHSNVP